MLCFQSSRDAYGVIHDSFSWMRSNVKAVIAVMIPMTVIAIVTFACFGLSILINVTADSPEAEMQAIFQIFMRNLSLRNFGTAQYSPMGLSFTLATLSFFTTLLYTPVLRYYFIDRRSVRDLTVTALPGLLMRCLPSAMITAAVTALFFFFVGILIYTNINIASILLMFAILFILCFVQPAIYTRHKPSFPRQGMISMSLRTVAYIILIFCVIKGFPFMCDDLLSIVWSFGSLTVNLSDSYMHTVQKAINIAVTAATYVSFCLAVISAQTSCLLLFGTCYEYNHQYNIAFKQ